MSKTNNYIMNLNINSGLVFSMFGIITLVVIIFLGIRVKGKTKSGKVGCIWPTIGKMNHMIGCLKPWNKKDSENVGEKDLSQLSKSCKKVDNILNKKCFECKKNIMRKPEMKHFLEQLNNEKIEGPDRKKKIDDMLKIRCSDKCDVLLEIQKLLPTNDSKHNAYKNLVKTRRKILGFSGVIFLLTLISFIFSLTIKKDPDNETEEEKENDPRQPWWVWLIALFVEIFFTWFILPAVIVGCLGNATGDDSFISKSTIPLASPIGYLLRTATTYLLLPLFIIIMLIFTIKQFTA